MSLPDVTSQPLAALPNRYDDDAMSVIAEAERLGAMVESGEISDEDAAERLYKAADGFLTTAGAASLIVGWRTARADYEACQ